MEIRLLGPVEISAGQHIARSIPTQQRLVLAVLAVNVGKPITAESLITRVWDHAPPGARRTLYVLITRVRRLLETASRTVQTPPALVRGSSGYLLRTNPHSIDVQRFKYLVDRASEPNQNHEHRAGLLRSAIGLWREEPLAGLPGDWTARTRAGWKREYLDAVVSWASAELRIGNVSTIVGPLTKLNGEYPLVEPLVAALMRALVATGQPATALDQYQAAKQRLAEGLGVDPGPELRNLNQAILRGELDHTYAVTEALTILAGGPPPQPAAAAVPVVPAQLPAGITGFAGRHEQLARLDALLLTNEREAPSAAVIAAVSGTAGVGKTTIAVHWAHRMADRFPDGQLYVNLCGFDRQEGLSPEQAVRGFLDALGVPPERIPRDPHTQTALYRSLIAGKRMMLLIDNARDSDQVRPLLPGTPTVVVVVTSRNQLLPLVAIEGAEPVPLDLLSQAEARELLSARLGTERVTAEPESVGTIINACARLPLALAIAAARARQTGFPLKALAAELHEVSGRLDALDIGEPNTQLRALLSWSYATLSPPAAELFRFLGLHPGPDVAVSAAASLSGRPVPETRRLLSELTKTNLLTEYVPGRYSFHDLLRAYARDLVATCDNSEARSGASRRMLDHYLHCAYAADRVIDPSRDPIAIPPPCPELTIQHPSDVQRALEWFTVERLVLLAVVAHALETGFDRHTWQLAWTLRTFLFHQGYWHDQATAGNAAVIAAQRSGDHVGIADARNILATACLRIGRFDDAHAQLLHALEQHCHDDNQAWQGPIQQSLGYLWEQQGCYARALEHVREALRIHRQAGNRRGMARALSSAGWLNALLGDHQSGISCCQRSLALLEELGDQRGLAGTWDSLGYAHHRIGEHREAQACFQQALGLFRQVGDRYHEAVILTHLGDSYFSIDEADAARTIWTEALEIFTDLGHGDAGPLRDKIKNSTAVS